MAKQELMGQIVTVNKEFKRRNKKYEVCDIKPRAGWIVGKRTIYSGHNDYYYDGWPVFIPTENHQCILVTYWPTMNPVKVPLDGYTLGGEPYVVVSSGAWPDKWKDEQREIMKNWPRRPNGQWKKYAELTKEERQNL